MRMRAEEVLQLPADAAREEHVVGRPIRREVDLPGALPDVDELGEEPLAAHADGAACQLTCDAREAMLGAVLRMDRPDPDDRDEAEHHDRRAHEAPSVRAGRG